MLEGAAQTKQEVELLADGDGGFLVQGHPHEQRGKPGVDGGGELVGQWAEVGEVFGMFGEFADLLKDFLAGEPVEEAAVVPFGEVLGADGDALEVFGEDGLDFGETVKPLDEFHAGFAVMEALVELVAEMVRETGDFAGAFHGIRGLGVHFSNHRWTDKHRYGSKAANTDLG